MNYQIISFPVFRIHDISFISSSFLLLLNQGKRILFLECLLDKGFGHYLVLLLKCETLTRQGLWDLDAFVLTIAKKQKELDKVHFAESLNHVLTDN